MRHEGIFRRGHATEYLVRLRQSECVRHSAVALAENQHSIIGIQ